MSISPSKVFVGLDYHQHTVQVRVLDEHGKQLVNATRPNSWQAVGAVVFNGVVVQTANRLIRSLYYQDQAAAKEGYRMAA